MLNIDRLRRRNKTEDFKDEYKDVKKAIRKTEKSKDKEKFKIVERITTDYCTIKVIPGLEKEDISSYFIAKSISEMSNVTKIFKKKGGSLLKIKENDKAVFLIDLNSDKVNFYFVIPKNFSELLKERMNEIFKNCSIEDVEDFNFPTDTSKIEVNSLSYKYNDTLSLNTECVNNNLNDLIINSQWLEGDDRIILAYNLFGVSDSEFKKNREDCFRKIKEGKEIDLVKNKITTEYMADKLHHFSIYALDSVFDILDGIFSGYDDKIKQYCAENTINPSDKISSFSRKKLYSEKLGSQIAIISYSSDDKRRKYNLSSITSSYASYENDNSLIRKKATLPSLYSPQWKIPVNYMSLDEVSQFLKFPARYILNENKNVEQIDVKQSKALDYLSTGNLNLGENNYKGKKTPIHMPKDLDSESFAHVFVAPQGSGKTTLLTNITIDAVKCNQANVIVDYIKNCEYANSVIPFVDKDKLIVIDADKVSTLPVFDFSEYKTSPSSTEEDIGKSMDRKALATEKIIETLNENEPLTSSMSRILSSACDVAYVHSSSKFADVIDIIQDYKIRESFMEKARRIKFSDKVLNRKITKAIETLETINDYENIKNEFGEKEKVLCGTKDTKVNGLLNRINKLNKSYILSSMLYNSTTDLNFAKLLSEGKTIVVKMPEHIISDHEKNVISTFIVMKTILGTFARGSEKNINRANLFIDEIQQVHTVENVIYEYLNRLRKLRLKVILTLHRLSQLNSTKFQKELLSSGAGFSLLSGSKEIQFRDFEEYSGDFTLEDIMNLKPFHAFHIIHTNKNGDWLGTTKLPSNKYQK